MPSIIKVDQIQSDLGTVNVSSNLQFSSGFTMRSPTLTTPTIATPTFTGQATIPTIDLTGGQIKFPASQNASADANTLDDYEEGRWDITITYDGSASGVTYTSRNGYYTKVGRVVTVHGVLNLSNKGTGSGSVRISLPFQSIAERGGLSCGNTQSLTGTNAARELMIEGGTNFFNVRYPSGTGSTTEISYTDIANNFYIVFGGCYMTT